MAILVFQYREGVTDPLWSSVVALFHGDDFTDETGKVWSEVSVGSMTGGNAGGQFGSYIDVPNPTSPHYITIEHNDLNMGSTYTIEGWFRPDAAATGNSKVWYDQALNSSLGVVCFLGTGGVRFRSNGTNDLSVSTSISSSSWTHIAWVATGTGRQIYIGGTLAGSDAVVPNTTHAQANIGTGSTASESFRYYGGLDEIRITDAVRYTANFTPEGPFPNQ